MGKIMLKLGAGATAAVLATLMFAGSAFACTHKCTIKKTSYSFTVQKNFAAIGNTVVVGVSTGDNEAEKNTGGDVKITTGDTNLTITITNTVNQTNK